MESDTFAPTSREIAASVLQDAEQRSRLLGYARSRFGIDACDAEDLLQETALELVRHRTIVRSPHGFVFRVFHTRCCRFLEARRRESPAAGGGTSAADRRQEESASRRVILREVFRAISSSCRRILLAYYVEGRSLRETARAIPLPYPVVWNTITRCLRRLRSCIAS